MGLLENIKNAFTREQPKPEEDYWKRNSNKKILAKILMPTEDEKKQEDAEKGL